MTVIAIDPGKRKCGICAEDSEKGTLKKNIADTEFIFDILKEYIIQFPDSEVICGNSFCGKELAEKIKKDNINIILTDEKNSTCLGRKLYWKLNPKPWWAFFIPSSMLVPKIRLDDYAAVIIARKYLNKNEFDICK